MTDTALKDGRIVGIAGPVIDAEFPQGELPEINTAIEFDVVVDGETITIVAEVAQQIGSHRGNTLLACATISGLCAIL